MPLMSTQYCTTPWSTDFDPENVILRELQSLLGEGSENNRRANAPCLSENDTCEDRDVQMTDINYLPISFIQTQNSQFIMEGENCDPNNANSQEVKAFFEKST